MPRWTCLCLAFLFAPLLRADPVAFHPSDWVFGTIFPGTPEVRSGQQMTKLGLVVTTVALWRDDVQNLSANRGVMAQDLPDGAIDGAYRGAINGMYTSFHGRDLNVQTVTIAGHEGRSCTWRMTWKNVVYLHDMRIVIVGRTAYLFDARTVDGQPYPAEATAFLLGVEMKAPAGTP